MAWKKGQTAGQSPAVPARMSTGTARSAAVAETRDGQVVVAAAFEPRDAEHAHLAPPDPDRHRALARCERLAREAEGRVEVRAVLHVVVARDLERRAVEPPDHVRLAVDPVVVVGGAAREGDVKDPLLAE